MLFLAVVHRIIYYCDFMTASLCDIYKTLLSQMRMRKTTMTYMRMRTKTRMANGIHFMICLSMKEDKMKKMKLVERLV